MSLERGSTVWYRSREAHSKLTFAVYSVVRELLVSGAAAVVSSTNVIDAVHLTAPVVQLAFIQILEERERERGEEERVFEGEVFTVRYAEYRGERFCLYCCANGLC